MSGEQKERHNLGKSQVTRTQSMSDSSWQASMSTPGKAPTTTGLTTSSRRCHRWRQREHLVAFVAGEREKRRQQGQDEVKLVNFNAECDVQEWVELPDELKKFGKCANVFSERERHRPDDYARRLVNDGFQRGACRCAWRRLRVFKSGSVS